MKNIISVFSIFSYLFSVSPCLRGIFPPSIVWKYGGTIRRIISGTVFLLLIVPGVLSQAWVEDSFEDFADGILDASGQNIYVSRSGSVRTIHRFDINSDGYIDLLFNSTHDDYAFIPATLAMSSPGRRIETGEIAIEGSLLAVVEDLNRDGFSDIVFCPNPSGIQRARRFVMIAWGGEDGWPAGRCNGVLPVEGAKTLGVTDLNGDGWPDIAIINGSAWLPGQPEGNVVRVYWGGVNGFLLSRYSDIGIPGAVDLACGDFDSDGAGDAAVLTSGSTIRVIWGDKNGDESVNRAFEPPRLTGGLDIAIPGGDVQCITAVPPVKPGGSDADGFIDLAVGTGNNGLYLIRGAAGRTWKETEVIKSISASHIAAGDIDGDSFPDLVLTYFSLLRAGGGEMAGGCKESAGDVVVLWGDRSGFAPSRITALQAPFARASAITDFDGDGASDIVIAMHQGEKVYAAESVVYYGSGNRRFEKGERGIPTQGAYHVAVIPAQKNRPAGVVFSNSRGGHLREEVPLNLYWGGPDGFDPNRRFQIPFRSGYEASAADLNEDGFVDLVAIDEMHGGQKAEEDPYHGANIFWGGPDGFDTVKRRTILNEQEAGTTNIADLNRDGYLDLVVGFFGDGGDGSATELVIYYGSNAGFDKKRRAAIPCPGRSNSPVIADFDKDGWLDIAVNSFNIDQLHVFRGSPEGFSEKNQTIIDIPAIIDLDAADLNGDGYLDIIACSYYDRISSHSDTGVFLLWGSPAGFRQWNAQWLPGMTPLAPVVADFDGDRYLDLFLPHYHGELNRELLPSYLYWGGPEGFRPRRRTALVNDSAADGLAADFNRDGLLDLAVVNHTVDGNHAKALSKVYYNDGKRFTSCSRIEYLPSPGSHWMWNEDMGHIYTRAWEQTYTSSVFNWKRKIQGGTIDADAVLPEGTKLVIAVRSAGNERVLETAPWRQVESSRFTLGAGDRCMQYRATFVSGNGDRYPVLDRVTVRLNP